MFNTFKWSLLVICVYWSLTIYTGCVLLVIVFTHVLLVIDWAAIGVNTLFVDARVLTCMVNNRCWLLTCSHLCASMSVELMHVYRCLLMRAYVLLVLERAFTDVYWFALNVYWRLLFVDRIAVWTCTKLCHPKGLNVGSPQEPSALLLNHYKRR